MTKRDSGSFDFGGVTPPQGLPSQRCDYHAKAIDDHESRLRLLEKSAWRAAGFAGACAMLGASLAKYILP